MSQQPNQLKPLSQRLTAHQLAMRADRVQWRSSTARAIGMATLTANGAAAILLRGFWGRLKWLFLGR